MTHHTDTTRQRLLEQYRDTYANAVMLVPDPDLTHCQQADYLDLLVRNFASAPIDQRLNWCYRISAFVDDVAVERMSRDLMRVGAEEDPRGVGDGLGGDAA